MKEVKLPSCPKSRRENRWPMCRNLKLIWISYCGEMFIPGLMKKKISLLQWPRRYLDVYYSDPYLGSKLKAHALKLPHMPYRAPRANFKKLITIKVKFIFSASYLSTLFTAIPCYNFQPFFHGIRRNAFYYCIQRHHPDFPPCSSFDCVEL